MTGNHHDSYSLCEMNEIFDHLNEQKGIDKIFEDVKEKLFSNRIDEHFKSFIRKFTFSYYLMKDKFSETFRSTGERYFEHLREVVNNVLELPDPSVDKIFIALMHDSIEDIKDIDINVVKALLGPKVAIGVQAISKKDWREYLNTKITTEKEAKEARNKDYFSHMKSFNDMRKHIRFIATMNLVDLTDEELDELTKNTLDVKFADRIHNLSTQWDPNDIENVERKVKETEKYFLDVAKEVNPEAYSKLKIELAKLKIQLERSKNSINTADIIENK